jgi:hypothetical protein
LQEFGICNLLSVAFDQTAMPSTPLPGESQPARLPYSKDDLSWFEHFQPTPPKTSFLRHLRARAIEAERSRISRSS